MITTRTTLWPDFPETGMISPPNERDEPHAGEGSGVPTTEVRSDIAGKVWKIEAAAGDALAADDTILVLESMKMEIPVVAPVGGRLVEIRVAEDEVVGEGDVVAVLDS